MGLFDSATDAASAAPGKVALSVAGSAYSFTGFQLSTVVSVATLVLTLFYLWGAMPRAWLTLVALKRGLFGHDWTLWQSLGKQPMQSKED